MKDADDLRGKRVTMKKEANKYLKNMKKKREKEDREKPIITHLYTQSNLQNYLHILINLFTHIYLQHNLFTQLFIQKSNSKLYTNDKNDLQIFIINLIIYLYTKLFKTNEQIYLYLLKTLFLSIHEFKTETNETLYSEILYTMKNEERNRPTTQMSKILIQITYNIKIYMDNFNQIPATHFNPSQPFDRKINPASFNISRLYSIDISRKTRFIAGKSNSEVAKPDGRRKIHPRLHQRQRVNRHQRLEPQRHERREVCRVHPLRAAHHRPSTCTAKTQIALPLSRFFIVSLL